MPGNVKLGSSNEPDPDPTPYLFVSNEQKRHDMTKPYDPKKSVWISDDEGGFHEGLLHSDDGKKAVVMVGHEVIGSRLPCHFGAKILAPMQFPMHVIKIQLD